MEPQNNKKSILLANLKLSIYATLVISLILFVATGGWALIGLPYLPFLLFIIIFIIASITRPIVELLNTPRKTDVSGNNLSRNITKTVLWTFVCVVIVIFILYCMYPIYRGWFGI